MRKLVIGMALASTAMASPALAREGQWYVELDGGVMIAENIDFDVFQGGNNPDSDRQSIDSFRIDAETGNFKDFGYDFGGIVGYDAGAFRLEAEASYREFELDNVQPGTTGFPTPPRTSFASDLDADGDPNILSFMVNGLFDFGPDNGLQGFVGGGVGVARTDLDVSVLGPTSVGGRSIDDSDTGFAWQILAGVRAPLTRSIDVGLKYRLFNQEDVQLTDAIGRGIEADLRTHSILGSLIFNFGGEEPLPPYVEPPMVTPPPPPPVYQPPVATAPPCNRGPYIVFFNWDKSDITPEAATILDSARSAYATCGVASVMLAGHTDTSGTKVYNQGLAERRNSSVRSYLSARGVPDARISSQAFGESQLRVPTADGVRELQNRRVEVTYGPGSGM